MTMPTLHGFAATRRLLVLGFVALIFAALSCSAQAQSVSGGDAPSSAGVTSAPTSAVSTSSVVSPAKAGDLKKGAAEAITELGGLFNNLISTAVTISGSIKSEADKFAFGLGVITLVLAGLRFAGSHHAIKAWADLFEELAVLGIFSSLYLGYTSAAPLFYTWFAKLATMIGGSANPVYQMASTAGAIFDSLITLFGAVHWWDIPSIVIPAIFLFFAFIVMLTTSLVFLYYTSLGQIQAAFGIVLGQIAIALGFSSYTRGYFKTWLDWMISSGMYVVVAAILNRLVGQSITQAFAGVTSIGVSTVASGAYVFDLSIFMFLLSFEIPKMAKIFGGAASANGGGGVGAAAKVAKMF